MNLVSSKVWISVQLDETGVVLVSKEKSLIDHHGCISRLAVDRGS